MKKKGQKTGQKKKSHVPGGIFRLRRAFAGLRQAFFLW
jgi:hypothetical protein